MTESEYKPFASKMRENLYRKLRMLAAADDSSVQALLEQAVEDYLEKRQFTEKQMSVREPAAQYGTRYSVSFGVEKDEKKKTKK